MSARLPRIAKPTPYGQQPAEQHASGPPKAATDYSPPDGKLLGDVDQTTITTLFRAHAPWLRAMLRQRGAPDPDELAQETYAHLARLPLASIERPQGFLLRVAENILRSQIRRERAAKRTAPNLLFRDVVQSLQGPQLESLILREAILALPTPYRDAFVLNRFNGMSYAEIAAAEGLTVKVVEYRVSRALAILRRALA